ncbi:hypothetical protein HNQ93_003625 [Hymenobacter luteus]|uniref:LPS export ABC transporter periplasmic protein LptC n=2 Tax=Hymenobacter TaxID=89966 RepID=A0A7W9T4G8_9BACT|nr:MULTISPECIES: hypothetical protein [Hymenobacter]MBB4602858.1 hypothetical protein [Hymenobacter latericoloratus]MBB6060750.1 hypothetical protein [Hymenobacter luteus]
MNSRLSLLPLALLLTLVAACRSEQETSVAESRDNVPAAVKGEQSTTETVGNTGRNHGYIRRFYQEKGQYYVTVDYIQFLNGADAVAAAQRKGDAVMDVQNGDTIYSVFNDYYIVNDSPRQRTFRLSDKAVLTFWNKTGELRQYNPTPSEVLNQGTDVFRYAPFIVETKQGVVTGLAEQYVP